jgi:hypothetical protein
MIEHYKPPSVGIPNFFSKPPVKRKVGVAPPLDGEPRERSTSGLSPYFWAGFILSGDPD